MLAPRGDERLDGTLLRQRQVGPIAVGALELDIEVAHRPEAVGDVAQARSIRFRAVLPVRPAEAPPRGALPASGDAHLVDVPRIDAAAHAGLAIEHPSEMEAHDLAPRLGHAVLGQDTR